MGIYRSFVKMKVFAGLVVATLAAPAPAIIHSNKVMCAAHCKQSSVNFTAGAGSVALNSQRQTQRVISQAAHPQYNSRLIDYDYMVITTQGTWNYDQYVAPIKIVSPSTSELPNGTPCMTSRYGYSQHTDPHLSPTVCQHRWRH